MPFKIFSPAINHNEIRQIECGDNFSGFLTKKGEVFSFGSNDEGQLAEDFFRLYMPYNPDLL